METDVIKFYYHIKCYIANSSCLFSYVHNMKSEIESVFCLRSASVSAGHVFLFAASWIFPTNGIKIDFLVKYFCGICITGLTSIHSQILLIVA